MSESEFREKIHEELKKSFTNYLVLEKENLLYKLFIDGQGELQPSDFRSPKRGQFAFQTDVVIKKGKVPLIVIETKFGGFSTHDVLTYSTKAMKHKEVYPYLRYGLVVGGKDKLDRKFFIHNVGFDFAVALRTTEDSLKDLVGIVEKQLKDSELLLEILENRKEVRNYVTGIKCARTN